MSDQQPLAEAPLHSSDDASRLNDSNRKIVRAPCLRLTRVVFSPIHSSRRFLRNYQGVAKMTWTKPEFKAISLSMEVTFYVNSR